MTPRKVFEKLIGKAFTRLIVGTPDDRRVQHALQMGQALEFRSLDQDLSKLDFSWLTDLSKDDVEKHRYSVLDIKIDLIQFLEGQF